MKVADVADSKVYVLAWDTERLHKASRIKPIDGEWFPANRYINYLNATGGIFIFDSASNGVVFTCLPAAAIDADYDALCMDGFPVPGTTRAGALDRTLTKFGVERGRFPMMYKTGSDTCAVTALLIHGASVHGNDGAPNRATSVGK